jgi:hypothetical protein
MPQTVLVVDDEPRIAAIGRRTYLRLCTATSC